MRKGRLKAGWRAIWCSNPFAQDGQLQGVAQGEEGTITEAEAHFALGKLLEYREHVEAAIGNVREAVVAMGSFLAPPAEEEPSFSEARQFVARVVDALEGSRADVEDVVKALFDRGQKRDVLDTVRDRIRAYARGESASQFLVRRLCAALDWADKDVDALCVEMQRVGRADDTIHERLVGDVRLAVNARTRGTRFFERLAAARGYTGQNLADMVKAVFEEGHEPQMLDVFVDGIAKDRADAALWRRRND